MLQKTQADNNKGCLLSKEGKCQSSLGRRVSSLNQDQFRDHMRIAGAAAALNKKPGADLITQFNLLERRTSFRGPEKKTGCLRRDET